MRYDAYEYLYPPRPENPVDRTKLRFYQAQGWIAQAKLNGTCNVMAFSPEGELTVKSRHKDDHKLWAPSTHTAETFCDLPGEGWYVFVAELMHSKVSDGPRDTNYIHDVLVADGDYLIGRTLAERRALLTSLFADKIDASKRTISHDVIDDHTWLARDHTGDFTKLFDELVAADSMYEGLVLKNPRAPLTTCSREKTNSNWQVKIRRPHKNYGR